MFSQDHKKEGIIQFKETVVEFCCNRLHSFLHDKHFTSGITYCFECLRITAKTPATTTLCRLPLSFYNILHKMPAKTNQQLNYEAKTVLNNNNNNNN